ncbi:MAG TPA: aldehyde dehydrogenase family protein [Hyphomicrobiales bacterium]|nr:aldehyde dehydrogenase family protein [Hyphomicrobiales bacterium]
MLDQKQRRQAEGLPLPEHRDVYYGGSWHKPKSGGYVEVHSPGSGELLGEIADTGAADAEAAIAAAKQAFPAWRAKLPLERAAALRRIAQIVRDNAEELALIDAADCGNPFGEMIRDATVGATQLDYFAGLALEAKGSTIPMGPDAVNYTVREPLGVVARIYPFNHPFMFCAAKMAAPLAAGNTVVMKPPEQAPLSTLRLAELIDGVLPPGVFNVVPGGKEVGAVLASHIDVAKVSVIGSVPTGKAVMEAAAGNLKQVLLELGGKNALIAYPDADPEQVAAAVIDGMNFTWCGQSCGSTSRAFIHKAIYAEVLEHMKERVKAYRPGPPTERDTTMGAIVSKRQFDSIMGFIETTKREGAELLCGGGPPDDPALANGFFIEPTIFTGMRPDMTIAMQEVFGPVLAVFDWEDEEAMIEAVNAVEYGLTSSIWTNDLATAHRTAARVQAGYVWINEVSRHFIGAPFGGYKQSGIGREESVEELFSFTQEKNVHVRLAPRG